MNRIKTRKPPYVELADFRIYCDSFKAVGKTVLTELPSVTSAPVLSNKYRRLTHIFITGRVCDEEKPMFFAGVVNNMNSASGFSIKYRDLKFDGCTVCGYTAEDRGDDFVTVTIELATMEYAVFLNEVSS